MMKKILKYDLLSNIFLFLSIILIITSFFLRDRNFYQYEIIFATVLLYLVSAFFHHYFDKSLTFEVGLEYILIGALAFLIVFGIAI
jgi:hypothetical protein